MKISVHRALFALSVSTFWVGSRGGSPQSASTPAPVATTAITCTGNTRNTESKCESDDNCIWTGTGSNKACVAVVTGNLLANQTCSTLLVQDPDGDYWSDVAGSACGAGLVCTFGTSFSGSNVSYNVPVSGTCESTQCAGKKVPRNCVGRNDASCNQATERVTICHRTCSAKNPWVRITIDNDAWNGTGCGHLREHDVSVECKNKAPWAEWGPNRKDYLIKWHGTRAQVATRLNNVAAEKKYWRMWEPACPYVRNGACCDWGITDATNANYNPCCGINPNSVVPPVPAIVVKKYAGPVGSCNAVGFSSGSTGGYMDGNYTVPSINANWQYCYVASVPNTSECIYNVRMTDNAPVGGITGSVDLTTPSVGPPADNNDAATLCPDEVVYLPGKIVSGLASPELGFNATVTGTGIGSGSTVTATDPAGVLPTPTPAPVTPTPAPVTPTPAPVTPTRAPVTPTPAPVTPTRAPITPTPAPVTPTPAPVTPTRAPVTPTQAPVTPTPAPVTPTPAPVTPTRVPVTPTPAPVTPTPAPVTPTPAPVTPTPAPVIPTRAPVTPTPAPVTPTPAPVTPTPAPVTPTRAPVTPTPAPVTPTPAPVTPAPVPTPATACDSNSRNTESKCESDDNCIWTGTGSNKACVPVVTGILLVNQTCATRLVQDPDGDYWSDVPGSACGAGLVCTFGTSFSGTNVSYNVPVNGTCESTQCAGKKVPRNCAGRNDASCNQATERVTICHRTCSAKNPWVRITIDNDAWNGTGCGHLREHDVSVECKNKAPWREWGPNRKDYLIKWHGTRAQVATRLNNVAAEKKYWRMWEPACPYVRNGACCDWGITDTTNANYNPCCGINPNSVVPPVPAIVVKKYAGPVGSCNAVGFSSGSTGGYMDGNYTVPNINANWQYCYVASVPNTSECIYNVRMTDNAPVGGIVGSVDLTTPSVGPPADNNDAATLCPDEVVYLPGKIVSGLASPELGFNATVTGTGIGSGSNVTASDPAGVLIVFAPSVTIKKFAGPHDRCPINMTTLPGPPMEPLSYLTDATKTFMYCYHITNSGNECLVNAKMTDLASKGTNFTFDAPFCPGDVKVIGGPKSVSLAGEPCVNANVMGTGQYSGLPASSSDDACVKTPRCASDMTLPGSQFCPYQQGVVLANVLGASPGSLATPPVDMIYNVNSVDGGSSVSFKVNNTYTHEQTMYIQYQKPASQGGWDQTCYAHQSYDCNHIAEPLVAGCLLGDGNPVALIQVYFVDNTSPSPFPGGAALDECCLDGGSLPSTAVVAQYSFMLRCKCPSTNI